MIGRLEVPIGDAAEKSMNHQPALDVMPDPGEGRIELLPTLFMFHGALRDRLPMFHPTKSARQARLQFYRS